VNQDLEALKARVARLSLMIFDIDGTLTDGGKLGAAAYAALWRLADGAYVTTGYKTQLLTLALFQLFVLARLGLRVMLMGGQLALSRRLATPEALASAA